MEPNKALGTLALLALLLAAKIGFIGMALWFESAYPATHERMLTLYQTRRRKCLITGIVNILLGALLIAFLHATKVLGFVAALLFVSLAGLIVIGYSIGYRDIGGRLNLSAPASLARTTLLGGLIAESAFLAPIAGQLLSLMILFRGLGAVIITLMARKTADPKITQ